MSNESFWMNEFKAESEGSCLKADSALEQQLLCKARVENECSGTCPNTPITPAPNIPITTTTNVVVKIPVVLAEATIVIPVISTIRLETRASELKRVRKNVFVTQCHLIPGSLTTTAPFTGILNIAGFVRKNIEFATNDCKGFGVSSGRIHDTTVEVPFSCTTTITFTIRPVFSANLGPTEIETLHETPNINDSCAENISGSNPCERNFSQTEVFNERVFCELVSAAVFESDINLNAKSNFRFPTELTFNEFTEKMVVNLTLKLLQKQQVRVTAIP